MANSTRKQDPSSYALITAQNILNDLGIQSSEQALKQQLQLKEGVAPVILQQFVAGFYNHILLDQIESLKQFCQGQLMDMLYLHYHQNLNEAGEPTGNAYQEDKLEQFKETYNELEAQIQQLFNQERSYDHDNHAQSKVQFATWQNFAGDLAHEITTALKQTSLTISDQFETRLKNKLLGIEPCLSFDKGLCDNLKLKNPPSWALRVIISALLED